MYFKEINLLVPREILLSRYPVYLHIFSEEAEAQKLLDVSQE